MEVLVLDDLFYNNFELMDELFGLVFVLSFFLVRNLQKRIEYFPENYILILGEVVVHEHELNSFIQKRQHCHADKFIRLKK